MMRKILTLALMLGVFMGFRLKINADISTYITSYSIEEEMGGEARLVFILTLEPTTSNISLMLPYRSTNTIDKNGVRSYLRFNFTDNTSSTLDWGDTFGNYFDWGNQPSCPNCPLLNLDLAYFNGKQPKTVVFSFTQTFNYDDTPSGFLEQYINEVQVYVDVLNNRVIYFANGEVFLNTIFATIPLRPVDPDPSEGYEFQYWALSNGSPYLFTDVTENMLNNGVLYLYAVFRPSTSTPPIPEPSTSVPTGLREILAIARLDNTPGYGVFYVIVSLVIMGVMALFLKANALIIGMAEMVWLFLSLFLGLLNLWITIAVSLFIVLIVMVMMRRGGLGEN